VTRAAAGLVLLACLAACIATPAPSERPVIDPTPSQAPSGVPTAAATAEPSSSPSETTDPTPTLQPFPDSTGLAGLPAALGQVAWAGSQAEARPDGSLIYHLYGGILGQPPTIRTDVEDPGGYPWIIPAEDLVGIVSRAGGSVRVEIRSAIDGATVATLHVDGTAPGPVAIDPKHDLAYVSIAGPNAGVEIHRVTFDGRGDDVLVKLDKRFTPDGIPTERYDLVLDPDGVLIVEACGHADGCRLWEIPPEAKSAPPPRTLPGGPPILCSIVGATRDWLVVRDDDVCWADTGDAPLPIRAIRRTDGRSHLVTGDHVGPGPLIEWGDRTFLVGADPIFIGATVDIVTYDLESGARSVELAKVRPGPDDATTVVSPTTMPPPWVLLEPWLGDNTRLPTIPARLFNLSTHELIELPFGTFGWT